MRNRLVFLLMLGPTSLFAQDQDKASPTQAAAAQPAAAQPPTSAQPAATAQPKKEETPPTPPPPAIESNFSGDIEFGERIIPNIGGSFNTYRSVVNLGEGPKLFGADATILNPNHRFFDRLDLHLTTIGDDPYQTAKVELWKRNVYRLTVDWRDMAYFNYLPSFANPFRSIGSILDESSFDTHIHNTDARLDLFPGSRFVPYLAFGHNSQDGRGITSFVVSQNNYPVATLYSDSTNNYRAGVDYNGARFHANLEQGGTTFKDDQGASDSIRNNGDLLNTFIGQRLFLGGLNEFYRVRGDSVYTRASFGANPVTWANISGQFVYAQPRVDVNYTENSSGNFYYPALIAFYTTGRDSLTGSAVMPHPSGNLNVELRHFKRIRIEEFWMTDRLHNASSDLLAQTLLFSTGAITPNTLATARLEESYNQQEVDVFFDATSKLTFRAGDRYVWGDAKLTAPAIVGAPYESGHLSQNVGLFGINYRAAQKIRLNADYEVANSQDNYFLVSLRNYTKFRLRGSHDVSPSLRVAIDYSLLTNSNPNPGINYTFSSQAASLSVNWLPRGGKWFNALLDYTRSSVQSDIFYIVPQTRTPDTSLYHENAHTGTALVSVKWVSFGGSLFVSSGSRPTQYYQPLVKLSVPLHKHVYWNAEWRYYGFAEDGLSFYALEGFRSNQFMTSLRFTR
jgi:hypothetical protein